MTQESNQKINGQLTYEVKVIEKIAGIALRKVDGLLALDGGLASNLKNKLINSTNPTDGVHAEVGFEEVAIDLDVVVEYDKHIPELFKQIQEVVASHVGHMTGRKVIEVNVNVVDVRTKEEQAKADVTVQDRLGSAAQTTGEFASEQFNNAKDLAAQGADKAKDARQSRVK